MCADYDYDKIDFASFGKLGFNSDWMITTLEKEKSAGLVRPGGVILATYLYAVMGQCSPMPR